ncbi:MAG: restriction endonuclease subunit S [Micropruina sp.]|nr:restriction endonuclease subunit S [Micropruina sp.]
MKAHTFRVSDLVAYGILRVEDGNHGEYRPRPDEFIDKGVPFIRAADMSAGIVEFAKSGKINPEARARIRKGIGQPGDVLLSHKGTVGKVAVAPSDAPDFVCSPQTTFWRSLNHDRLDQRYLRCFMGSEPFQRQLHVLMGQTDMAPYVSLTDQRSLLVALPEIADQRAIAEVLGALDDKIAANTRIADRVAELARTKSPRPSSMASRGGSRTAPPDRQGWRTELPGRRHGGAQSEVRSRTTSVARASPSNRPAEGASGPGFGEERCARQLHRGWDPRSCGSMDSLLGGVRRLAHYDRSFQPDRNRLGMWGIRPVSPGGTDRGDGGRQYRTDGAS